MPRPDSNPNPNILPPRLILLAAEEILGHDRLIVKKASADDEAFTLHDLDQATGPEHPPALPENVVAQIRTRARQLGDRPPPYRIARANAYRDELGQEQGDYMKTVGDVFDTVIAELAARGAAATPAFAALTGKIAAIKARIPKP